MMEQILVDGNEAVAWAAFESNVTFLSHYPGSPVNKIAPKLFELSKKFNSEIKFNDALNEHVATLSAQGASLCGARSLVVMKHVGMNIAADPLNYLGLTGVVGGMLIVVGTDPGASCSTGEEDPHWYIPQLNFPVFEPTSVREIFELTKKSYLLSEKYKLPCLMFIPASLCNNHSTISVSMSVSRTVDKLPANMFKKNFNLYVNVGTRSVINNKNLFEKIWKIAQENICAKSFFSKNSKIGIITRGATFGHVFESVERLGLYDLIHLLNYDLVFPLNKDDVLDFVSNKDEVIVIEDQGGFLENQIKNLLYNHANVKIYGKNYFPPYGEISFAMVYNFLQNYFSFTCSKNVADSNLKFEVPERLGVFCEGCPHRSSFFIIDKVLKEHASIGPSIIGGDIGCSSLPPQRADWLLCMNAGIGIAQGIVQLGTEQLVISTGGDGSFFHGGLISLISAVHNKLNLLHIVLDNEYIAMTGHQLSPTSKNSTKHVKLLKAVGVDHVLTTNAFRPKDYERKLEKLIKFSGVRVLWVKGKCAKMRSRKYKEVKSLVHPFINYKKCGKCTICYSELQCPAIVKKTGNTFSISLEQCQRCGVCKSICPNGAVSRKINTKDLFKVIFSNGQQ